MLIMSEIHKEWYLFCVLVVLTVLHHLFTIMKKNFSLLVSLLLVVIVFCSLKPMDNEKLISEDRSRCTNYVDVKTDTITGIVRLMAKEKVKLLDKDGKMVFDMMMIRHNKEFTLHFKGIKEVCFNRNSKVSFEFTDDTVSDIRSSNNENCKGIVSVNMGGIFGDARMIKKLSSSTLRNIKIVSKSDSYQIDLDIDQKERILNTFDCFIYN